MPKAIFKQIKNIDTRFLNVHSLSSVGQWSFFIVKGRESCTSYESASEQGLRSNLMVADIFAQS